MKKREGDERIGKRGREGKDCAGRKMKKRSRRRTLQRDLKNGNCVEKENWKRKRKRSDEKD